MPELKPPELDKAQMILGLCREFHCLPSQLYDEGLDLLYLVNVEDLGRRKPENPAG